MARIVVGVDGSSGSRAALRFAAEEARLRHADLDILISWEYPVLGSVPVHVLLPSASDMEGAAQATIDDILEAEGLAATGADDLTIRSLITEGPAAPALIAASTDADLLVVGSRGHGGFTGLLLGSVSQHCVTNAVCPVVVVPEGES